MFLWRRAALGASGFGRCRCRFGLLGQYDRGRVGGCQGGILVNMSLGGIPAYAGMTGGGTGYDGRGREWGNAKAQGRNEE